MGFTPFNPSYKNYCQVYSKGMATIPIDIGSQTGSLDRLGQQVHPAAEKFAELGLEAYEADQRDVRFRIEVHDEVDVAVRAGLASRDRAEQ